jgi:hypothetical protein
MMQVLAYSSGYAWAVKLAIFLVGAAIWAVVNHLRKKQVAEEFHLDPKVVLPFKAVTSQWEEEVEPERTKAPLWAWFIAGVLLVAAVCTLLVCMQVSRNWEYLLGSSVFLFILCPLVVFFSRVRVPSVVLKHRCDFSESCISVTTQGQVSAFEIGRALLIVVGVEEIIRKRGGGQFEWDEFLGFKYTLRLKDGYRDTLVPMDFVGSGEFLASCSHRGAKVEFAPSCPSWYVAKMKGLPSWKPGYFAEATSPLVARSFVDMVCASCGGRGQYEVSAPRNLCQYCGSGKLATA